MIIRALRYQSGQVKYGENTTSAEEYLTLDYNRLLASRRVDGYYQSYL